MPGATVALVEPEAVRQETAGLFTRAREDRARRSEGLLPEVAEALVSPEDFAEYLAGAPVVAVREIESEGEALHVAAPRARHAATCVGSRPISPAPRLPPWSSRNLGARLCWANVLREEGLRRRGPGS
jgi:hypothetical protein